MRVVVLSSSPYSETACAATVRLCEMGCAPVGILTLRTTDAGAISRKIAQWGIRDVVRYARMKLPRSRNAGKAELRNQYLTPWLLSFANLHQVATKYRIPLAVCADQNSSKAVAQLTAWSSDIILFSGGNILRRRVLEIPRLGVINIHLGLLPEIRGMSSPEWALLNGVAVGVTIHSMDAGIDTGPILLRRELPEATESESIDDLRNRLIAFGIEQLGSVITGLEHGTISPTPQSELDRDNQFFVMHERLRRIAIKRLQAKSATVTVHG